MQSQDVFGSAGPQKSFLPLVLFDYLLDSPLKSSRLKNLVLDSIYFQVFLCFHCDL